MMAKPRQPRHSYTVHLVRYRSEKAKQALEQGEAFLLKEDPLIFETWSCGWNKRTAAVKFYNVCREAVVDPLASRVIITHGEEWLYVWVDRQRRLW
jgi:hypothetical protein